MEFVLKTPTRQVLYLREACGKLSLLAPQFQLLLWCLAAPYSLASETIARLAQPLIQPW
jgi:hypothetical protein